MNIGAWLRRLDLGQYEQCFRENHINADVLFELSQEDLQKLGVKSIGHQRKILKEIAHLQGARPAKLSGENLATLDNGGFAERRQLAVMFCDLVGSTALSAQLDPEDMRDLMQRYQDIVSSEIVRFGGHVAKFLGDGVLAYFGYPTAHEDSTERAIRAGLGIVAAMLNRQAEIAGKSGATLHTRVGIESGLVVVGDMIGEAASESAAIVGETPNLASRLEGVAAPGEVVIGPAARSLAGYAFRLDDLGPQSLKGMTKPVNAWKVIGEADTDGRFEATRGPSLTPFVGRDAELALLMEKWGDACACEGRVVFVSGEAGIGKSRLTQVLRDRLKDTSHTRLNYQCSPYHTSSALHPILRQFERAAGFVVGDDPETKLDKLETTIAPGPMVMETAAPLFAAMLGLATGDRYPALAMTPQKQKAETLKALADQVAALTEDQPLLLIFEDAHWIDPTSQEAIEVLAARIAGLKALLVVTHRPEYAPPPGMQAMGHVSTLSLARLGRRQAAELATHVTGDAALSDDTLAEIVTRTDGVPLFIEELTKTVMETGAESAAAIPTTLNDSLMVRLDRMSPVRETAQIAACIGREFDTDLLAAVSPLGDNALREALDDLVKSELIFRTGTGQMFKHSLVQTAAYESLLKSRRQELHGKIARALEDGFSDIAMNEPEVIARHFTDANDLERAVEWWLKAGRTAMRRYAYLEGIAHLENGLTILARLPAGKTRDELELEFYAAIAGAHFVVKGLGSAATEAVYKRYLAPCARVGHTPHEIYALIGLTIVYWSRGEMVQCEETTHRLLHVAKRSGDETAIMLAYGIHGYSTLLFTGRFAESVECVDKAWRMIKPAHEQLVSSHGWEPSVFNSGWRAYAMWLLGYPDQAMEWFERSLEIARRLQYPSGLGYVMSTGCLTAVYCGSTSARSLIDEGRRYSVDQGMPDWQSTAILIGGLLKVRSGEFESGMRDARAGEERLREKKLAMTRYNTVLAEAALACGNPDAALSYTDAAILRNTQTNEHSHTAEQHHLKGLALQAKEDASGAETSMLTAIDIARGQSAKSWELRAATSLAHLWRDQGRRGEARDLLAPVYNWFTEGFGTPDLKAAKALLDKLGGAEQ